MKAKSPAPPDDLRPEDHFDYSTAVRGKYYRRLLREGANVAVLEPDVAKAFRHSAAVNEALRSRLQISATPRRLTRPASAPEMSSRRARHHS
jgi:hypothetical protein